MNSNNLSESIKNNVNTILKTNDLISIKEILESNYKTVPNEYKSEYFDFIELFLIQEIKNKEISQKNFSIQHNAPPLLELAERQKQKRKFINKWLIDKKQNTLKQPEANNYKCFEKQENVHFENLLNKFNDDKTINKWSFQNQKYNYYESKRNYIEKTENLNKINKQLSEYLHYEQELIKCIFNIYKRYYKYKNHNETPHLLAEIDYYLRQIKQFDGIIKHFKFTNEYDKAITLKDFIINSLNDINDFLYQCFSIALASTPILDKINDLIDYFNNVLNINEILILKDLNKKQPEPEAIDLSDTTATEKKQINNFDANHFNTDCYNLFCYLVDNYKKKGIIKFINIYYYLKDEVKKEKYSFRFIQNEYTEFIKKNYKVEIKKYQKAMFDFDEQKRVLNSLEEQFRTQ